MANISINDYPSPTVRNGQMKSAYLIDGGLCSAFHKKFQSDIELIEHFPPNCDIFLFYNSRDKTIVERMQKLKTKHSNVHIFPNIIPNARNGTDINLSFVLGTISDKYENFVIVSRHDKIFNELKQRLESSNSRLKNHVELCRFDSPKELIQHMFELSKEAKEECEMKLISAASSSECISFTPDRLFHRCPLDSWESSSRLYRFQELIDHLDAEHSGIEYQYCEICQRMIQENDWSDEKYRKFGEHFQNEHLNQGFSLFIMS